MTIKPVKGMKDLLQQAMPLYRHVISASQDVLEDKYGFDQVMSNMVEPDTLYRKTLGVTSDIVLKEMYQVVSATSQAKAKDEQSGSVLRPEGTAGVLRAILGDHDLMRNIRKEQVRAWYWGPMFRHERPQTGRLRQFYQLGVEMVGGTKPDIFDMGYTVQSDFEAIESAWACLGAIYGDKVPLEVEINNLGGQNTLTEYNKALTSLMSPKMADFSQTSQQRLQAGHALRILDSKSPVDQEVISSLGNLPDIDDFIDAEWRDSFEELQELLSLHSIRVRRNPKLVRGLDYYNGTCFEIKLAGSELESVLGKSQNTLLAGGRYDYLASCLSAKAASSQEKVPRQRLPAIGWAAGVDRLVLLQEALSKLDSDSQHQTELAKKTKAEKQLGITSITDSQADQNLVQKHVRQASYLLKQTILGLQVASTREQGKKVIENVTVDLRDQLKLNDRLSGLLDQAKAVVVIGPPEAELLLQNKDDQVALLQVEVPVKISGIKGHQLTKVGEISKLYS